MDEEVNIVEEVQKPISKVGQDQIHELIFSNKLSWQAIIYDLINTEQLNPWDIDISLLANKYLEKIRQLEESNFFISSKVLLAAALLLRMKSEILLDQDLPELDAILYGRKDQEKKSVQERIELDEEIPGLVPRTPLPRFKKVTLQELLASLDLAINTENRRIRKVVLAKQQEMETSISLPKTRINLKDKIHEIYAQLKDIFSKQENKVAFSEISGKTSEERIATFVPLLHLDNQQKVWLEQPGHLEEIWILLKHLYEKQNREMLEQLRKEVEEEMNKMELDDKKLNKAKKLEGFENPVGDLTG
jgi:segregation and condensation protein A